MLFVELFASLSFIGLLKEQIRLTMLTSFLEVADAMPNFHTGLEVAGLRLVSNKVDASMSRLLSMNFFILLDSCMNRTDLTETPL